MSLRHNHETIASALGAAEPLPETGSAVDVLFFPSFDAECAVRIVQDGAGARLLLRAMRVTRPPALHAEEIRIPQEDAARLWRDLAAAAQVPLDTQHVVLDGMRAVVRMRIDGAAFEFEHNTGLEGPATAVAQLVHREATRLSAPESEIALEGVFGYLHDSLPVKERPGPPRTLRFFGRISSSNSDELDALIAGIAPTEPLIMDVSNVSGMGTLLYPHFGELRERRGRTVWVTGPGAQGMIEAVQPEPEDIVTTVQEARTKLGFA